MLSFVEYSRFASINDFLYSPSFHLYLLKRNFITSLLAVYFIAFGGIFKNGVLKNSSVDIAHAISLYSHPGI